MGHVKLNDRFFDTPKVLRAGTYGAVLFVCGICYAHRSNTGTFIPDEAKAQLKAESGVHRLNAAIDSLIRAGLWERVDGGYRVLEEGVLWKHGPRDDARLPWQEWSLLRDAIFERDDYTCRYCGQYGGELECDHVIPVSRGGTNDRDNLVTACKSCNSSKGAKLLEEWVR